MPGDLGYGEGAVVLVPAHSPRSYQLHHLPPKGIHTKSTHSQGHTHYTTSLARPYILNHLTPKVIHTTPHPSQGHTYYTTSLRRSYKLHHLPPKAIHPKSPHSQGYTYYTCCSHSPFCPFEEHPFGGKKQRCAMYVRPDTVSTVMRCMQRNGS